MDIREVTVSRAEELLVEWAAVSADRDARVLIAHRSRVPKRHISRLTGLSRGTIDRIIAGHAAGNGS